jgi:hypothetical protein
MINIEMPSWFPGSDSTGPDMDQACLPAKDSRALALGALDLMRGLLAVQMGGNGSSGEGCYIYENFVWYRNMETACNKLVECDS